MNKNILFFGLILFFIFLFGCTSTTSICGDNICSDQESNPDSSYFCTQDCGSEINQNAKVIPTCSPCHSWDNTQRQCVYQCTTDEACCSGACVDKCFEDNIGVLFNQQTYNNYCRNYTQNNKLVGCSETKYFCQNDCLVSNNTNGFGPGFSCDSSTNKCKEICPNLPPRPTDYCDTDNTTWIYYEQENCDWEEKTTNCGCPGLPTEPDPCVDPDTGQWDGYHREFYQTSICEWEVSMRSITCSEECGAPALPDSICVSDTHRDVYTYTDDCLDYTNQEECDLSCGTIPENCCESDFMAKIWRQNSEDCVWEYTIEPSQAYPGAPVLCSTLYNPC